MSIRPCFRKDRPAKPWGAKWSQDGKRRFQFFASETERDAFVSSFEKKARRVGPALFDLSAADAVIMAECVRRLGSSSAVLRAVEDYAARAILNPVLVADAISEFLDEKLNAGLDDDYVRHLKKATERFEESFSGPVAEVSAADARTWSAALDLSPRTAVGHIKIMRGFFNWLIDRAYAVDNVFAKVPLPKVTESEPEFLSVESVQALLSTAQQSFPDAAAYFALGAFAGIRSSAVVRLDGLQHIRFEQRGILITAENAKNSRRQFIDGHEANLWAWLEWCKTYAPEGFALNARMWERRRGQVAEAAGVSMPHNALRHSFCTYHVALHGNAGKTATLLTHRGNVAILYQHYKGNATKSEAETYFSIRPSR